MYWDCATTLSYIMICLCFDQKKKKEKSIFALPAFFSLKRALLQTSFLCVVGFLPVNLFVLLLREAKLWVEFFKETLGMLF